MPGARAPGLPGSPRRRPGNSFYFFAMGPTFSEPSETVKVFGVHFPSSPWLPSGLLQEHPWLLASDGLWSQTALGGDPDHPFSVRATAPCPSPPLRHVGNSSSTGLRHC